MTEAKFNISDLQSIKKIGVRYINLENKVQFVDAEIKFISENNITAFFFYKQDFDLNAPQEITIKYATPDGLCSADATVSAIKKVGEFVYLTITIPQKVMITNLRKYYRINLQRTCVLIATDKEGHSSSFMSRVVDVSAGGVLIHKLESMFNDKFVTIEPADYEIFNIVLFLDVDIVLKLSARYVRTEKVEGLYRYAFEFINMKHSDTDTISKYVTKEQVKQLHKANQ